MNFGCTREGSIMEQRSANATSSKIRPRTCSTILKCRHASQYHHCNAPNRLAYGRRLFLGATMRIDLFNLRNLKVTFSLTFCLTMLPAPSHAFTLEDQRRLCTGDVFRLCSSEIPDRARITACMRRQRASLSQGCRSVFGKPSDQSASANQSVGY
jgi:hypothetical protein